MTVNFKKLGEFCIVELPKNILKKEYVDDFKNAINEIIEQEAKYVLVNLINIANIDGIGLGSLLSLQKAAFMYNMDIKLFGLQPNVAQMVYQTRLNRVFDIFNTDSEICEEALLDNVLIA